MESILVVGAGLAGLAAARAAREVGFTGRLTVLGREPGPAYDRPPLSKEYLAGSIGRDALALTLAGEEHGVAWCRGTAVALDPTAAAVTMATGGRLHADGIVVASGARARRLPDLAEADNVITLRTVADADRLRRELGPGRRLVVVGAGLVGAEVASTARGLGCVVTVLSRDAEPLSRLYGSTLSPYLAALYDRSGVELRAEVKISAAQIVGRRVEALSLSDGTELETDVVLVAVGAEPETGWLGSSGLDLGDGLLCDAGGRVARDGTPLEHVVAVGDCAAWWDSHLGRHHRSQHWTDALERPVTAVANLLGRPVPRRRPYLPYFWSDQFGHRIQMAGYASLADDVEVSDGDPSTGPFVAVYRRSGEPVAVLALSRPREFSRWRKMLVASLGHVPEASTNPSRLAAPAAGAPTPTIPSPTARSNG